jgi:hypothetical protein
MDIGRPPAANSSRLVTGIACCTWLVSPIACDCCPQFGAFLHVGIPCGHSPPQASHWFLHLWGLAVVDIQSHGTYCAGAPPSPACPGLNMDQQKYKEGFLQMQECSNAGTPGIADRNCTLLSQTTNSSLCMKF